MFVVAKRKSLFDDKGDEIHQLTFVVKQDLSSLNKQIAQLQEVGWLVWLCVSFILLCVINSLFKCVLNLFERTCNT